MIDVRISETMRRKAKPKMKERPMTKEKFELSLRQYLERRPFQPFVVELRNGRRLTVKQLPVAYSDGGA